MFRKPLPWILLVVVCVGAAVYSWHFFPRAFPIVNVELTMDRTAALDSARAQAEELDLGPDGFRQAAEFRQDSEVQTFVELEGGGKDAFRRMIESDRYQPYQWVVRHFQEQEPREAEFRFTPDGVPYGFEEQWPEDAPGPALAPDSARTIAEQNATRHWQVDLSHYELISSSQETRPSDRVDHTFVYERPDVQLGDGRYRLRLGVSGSALSEVTRFVHVPEAFSRRYQEMRSANSTINVGGLVAVGLLYVLGGCLFGLFWLLRRGALKWRMALLWGGIVGGLQLLASLNQLPLAWMGYDTALPAQSFLLQQVLIAVVSAVGMGLLVTVSFMAAEGLTRVAFGHHPRLWRVWNPEAAGSTTILGHTVAGYLLVAMFFAYNVTLYFYAQEMLGWWTPSDLLFNPDILAQYAPWLPPIANALQAGFWEECLFRAVPLAGAALIGDRWGGRRWWIGGALVLQAIIFGAGHAGYSAQPAYARVVELILPSLGFGLLYLAYGLLPAIVLHFAYDVVWMALPIFVSSAPGIWISQGLVVGLTLVPLLVVAYGRLHTGRWIPLPERFYNRSWSPSEEANTEPAPLPIPAGLSRRTVGALAVAGLVGLGAWVGSTSFTTPEIPLSMTRSDAETTARSMLEAEGVDLSAWTMASAVQTPNGTDDDFVWQEGGPEAYRQLMGTFLSGPYWRVRFYTFEGPVEERAEEYRVHLAPGSDRQEIVHRLPEAAPGDSLSEPAARSLADSVIQARYDRNPAQLERVGAEPTARPNRRDWTFTYADTTGYPLDQGEARLQVELAGSEVTDASTFIHVPEAWSRDARRRSTQMQIVNLVTGLLAFLILLGGAGWGIVYWAQGSFRPWTFLVVAGGVFLLMAAGAANNWPATVAGFNTAQPYLNQVLLTLLGSLFAAAFVSGGMGLIAGVTHARIGGNKPIALRRPIVGGLGAGVLAAGLLALTGYVGPSLSPSWSSYGALDAAVPWLHPTLSRLPLFIAGTLSLLLVAVVLHRWTRAATKHRMAALGSAFALGFVAAGLGPAEHLGTWALQGALIGGLFAGAVPLIWRYDRALIPMVVAGIVVLQVVRDVATAAHPYAVPGELLAGGVFLTLAVAWTYVLQQRQSEAASSAPV